MKLITSADVIVAWYAGRHPAEIAQSLGKTLAIVLDAIDRHQAKMRDCGKAVRQQLRGERAEIRTRLRRERDERAEARRRRRDERHQQRERARHNWPTAAAAAMAFSAPVEPGVRERAQPPRYLPTEEEIAARCEAIQATWTPLERRLRWQIAHQVDDVVGPNGAHRRGWTPQELRCVDFCLG